jgi:hypothetical protein
MPIPSRRYGKEWAVAMVDALLLLRRVRPGYAILFEGLTGKIERHSAPVHNPLPTQRLATTLAVSFSCSSYAQEDYCGPHPHQRRTWLDWGCSRHARLPQSPQISVGLALPTEELLSPHQLHRNCKRVRLSNDSIAQNPHGTLPCISDNKAYLASPLVRF